MDQETALLKLVLPNYEKIVRDNITVDLVQHEFDALVSVAYNPGGSFTHISDLINAGEVAEAMASIKSRLHSNGLVLPGLVSHRNGEVAMYLYGRYEKG